jgi:hypothetical protein
MTFKNGMRPVHTKSPIRRSSGDHRPTSGEFNHLCQV